MWVSACVWTYAYTHVWVYACVYTRVCVRVCVCFNVYNGYMHHTYTRMQLHQSHFYFNNNSSIGDDVQHPLTETMRDRATILLTTACTSFVIAFHAGPYIRPGLWV